MNLDEFNKAAKVVGYDVGFPDNGTEMWASGGSEVYYGDIDPRLPTCPRCHTRTDFFATNPDYKTKRTGRHGNSPEVGVIEKTALAATYDGQTIASLAFRDWCMSQEYVGVEFRAFPLDPNHFHLIVHNMVAYDADASDVQFYGGVCPVCGNYRGATAGRRVLKVTNALADGFYRTDLLFAKGRAKNPLLIVPADTKEKLKAAKMRGLCFLPAYALRPHAHG